MWVELQGGSLVGLDNNGAIFIRPVENKFSIIYRPNDAFENVIFTGSKKDCKKVLYRLSEKLGAIDITNLLYDEVVLDPVEAIRRLRHE